jgi:hypothetical protein
MRRFERCNKRNGSNPGPDEEDRTTKPAKTGKEQAGNRGQFMPGISGNPHGRPEGSRNKATLAVQALMDGEAENLTRKIVKLAKGGDLDALRFCLSRIIPPQKNRAIALKLPRLKTATDIPKAFECVLHAVGEGEVSPTEAQALGAIIESCGKGLELSEIETRLKALEERVEHHGKS